MSDEPGMWTVEEIIWARDCFAQFDTVREIADVSGRDFLDVALQLGVYGYVQPTRRTVARRGPTRWIGGMLREVAIYRRRHGETRQALAALAGVKLNTMDMLLRGTVQRGRKPAATILAKAA